MQILKLLTAHTQKRKCVDIGICASKYWIGTKWLICCMYKLISARMRTSHFMRFKMRPINWCLYYYIECIFSHSIFHGIKKWLKRKAHLNYFYAAGSRKKKNCTLCKQQNSSSPHIAHRCARSHRRFLINIAVAPQHMTNLFVFATNLRKLYFVYKNHPTHVLEYTTRVRNAKKKNTNTQSIVSRKNYIKLTGFNLCVVGIYCDDVVAYLTPHGIIIINNY